MINDTKMLLSHKAGKARYACPRCGAAFKATGTETHLRDGHPGEAPWSTEELGHIAKSARVSAVTVSMRRPHALDRKGRELLRADLKKVLDKPTKAKNRHPKCFKKSPNMGGVQITKIAEENPSSAKPELAFMRKCCGTWYLSSNTWGAHRKALHAKRKVPKKSKGYYGEGEHPGDARLRKARAKGIFGNIFTSRGMFEVSGGLPGLGKRR